MKKIALMCMLLFMSTAVLAQNYEYGQYLLCTATNFTPIRKGPSAKSSRIRDYGNVIYITRIYVDDPIGNGDNEYSGLSYDGKGEYCAIKYLGKKRNGYLYVEVTYKDGVFVCKGWVPAKYLRPI